MTFRFAFFLALFGREGWEEMETAEGEVYFFHAATNTTEWDHEQEGAGYIDGHTSCLWAHVHVERTCGTRAM